MKKGKAVLVWIGIACGAILALLLILAGGYYWIAGRPLAKKLAELRAAEEPLCLADLARKPIPAERNGATYLLEAKADVEAVEKAIYAIKEPTDGKYPPEDLEKIHAILAAYPKILPLLQKAAAAPDFQFQRDYSVKPGQFSANNLPLLQIKRTYFRYLKAHVDDLLIQGKSDEALQTTMLMLKLTRQYDRDIPTIMDYLVNIACKGMALECGHKILQSGPIDDRLRAAFDAELVLHDSLDSCRAAMKGERAYCLDALQNEMPPFMLTGQWQLTALKMFDDFFEYSSQPYSTGVSKGYRQPPGATSSIVSGPVGQTLPAWKAMLECAYRNQARVRSLRIINALQRKAPPESDKVPGMAELGLSKEVGIDPFNGKPLIVKKLPEGWLVYSVGQNLQDDGGKLGALLDVGFGPKPPQAESKEKASAPSMSAE